MGMFTEHDGPSCNEYRWAQEAKRLTQLCEEQRREYANLKAHYGCQDEQFVQGCETLAGLRSARSQARHDLANAERRVFHYGEAAKEAEERAEASEQREKTLRDALEKLKAMQIVEQEEIIAAALMLKARPVGGVE